MNQYPKTDSVDTVPSLHRCFSLFDQFEMLTNIRAHSTMVARVASVLIDGLRESAEHLPRLADRQLVISGALLHDIAKSECIRTGCHHAAVGRDICRQLGYNRISEIVEEHVVLKKFERERYQQGDFLAKELVYYADKRVRHDEVVSLEDRLSYIIDRYGDNNADKERFIRLNFSKTQQFEEYLFIRLAFEPTDIASLCNDVDLEENQSPAC